MKRFLLMLTLLVLLQACSSRPEFVDNGNPGSLRVILFNDLNGNRLRDQGETGAVDKIGISQVTSCPSANASQLTEHESDASGEIRMEGLTPGIYCVQYIGSNGTTTRLAQEVPVSSEQESSVTIGITERN